MKVLVYGSGALGTVIGGALTRKGVDVDLADINPEIIQALDKKGARVRGGLIFSVPVNAYLPSELTEQYDVIFLSTRARYNEDLVPELEPLLKKDGVLITLQSGIPEPFLAEKLGEDRVMGCSLDWTASFIEPGCSKVDAKGKTLKAYIGKMPDVPSGRVMEARRLMENICMVHYVSDILGRRWSRLVSDCSMGAVSALTGTSYGDILKSYKAMDIVLRSMKECIRTGRAHNAQFTPLYGKKISFYYYHTIFKKWFLMMALRRIYRHRKDAFHSFGQDSTNGGKIGIEFVCGVVCKYAREVHVPTPVNKSLTEVIQEQEKGLLPIAKEALYKIKVK